MLFSTDDLEAEEKELRQEMEVVSGMIRNAINENAHVAIVKRFDDAKAKYDAVRAEMDDKRIRRAVVEQFLTNLGKRRSLLTEFELEAWHSLVDFVTVYSLEDIRSREIGRASCRERV